MRRLHRSSSRCTFVNQRTDRANAHPMSRVSCGHHSHQPVKEPRGHGFTFSRHECPSDARNVPSKNRGRRECRMLAAPMARLQQETQAAVTTGKAGTTGIPCAMALRLIAGSPRRPGFVVSVACRSRRVGPARGRHRQSTGLTPASGGQDHTPLPSVRNAFVRASSALSTLTSTASRSQRP